ncbi:ribonuclease hii [hydrocarbon metagenome]|uniref:Ribonuclease HII n=1 Tax=hydrocarbon metagenome TaxID=938273 RepID=A0A0W8E7T1_9ZZZZ
MSIADDESITSDELQRLKVLNLFEEQAYQTGYQFIAGLDEVGRGPIAGPVVAGAVILPRGFTLVGVDDSKKLTGKKREILAREIKRRALTWSVGYVYPPCLDQINILNATRRAMTLAVSHLHIKPDYLLIDALKLDDISIEQGSIIKGDSRSISIACASIIAKVERDEAMREMDSIFPGYNFSQHKGYATREHLEKLFARGPCAIHRQSFEPVKSILAGGKNEQQPGLFDQDDIECFNPGRAGAESK